MISQATRRRTTTWMAIVGYGLLASGLPLPVGVPNPRGDVVADTRVAAKDRSRPFPCMDRPCGCATAEQCFANCCCHTPAERLAWAKAHQVEPALLATLERRVAADVVPAEPAAGCCAGKVERKPACCDDRRDLADEPDVCSDYQSLAANTTAHHSEPTAPPSNPDEPTASAPPLHAVSLQSMLACGGILTQWLSVGGSLPPSPVNSSFAIVPLCTTVTLVDTTAFGVRSAPDAPPPRT